MLHSARSLFDIAASLSFRSLHWAAVIDGLDEMHSETWLSIPVGWSRAVCPAPCPASAGGEGVLEGDGVGWVAGGLA